MSFVFFQFAIDYSWLRCLLFCPMITNRDRRWAKRSTFQLLEFTFKIRDKNLKHQRKLKERDMKRGITKRLKMKFTNRKKIGNGLNKSEWTSWYQCQKIMTLRFSRFWWFLNWHTHIKINSQSWVKQPRLYSYTFIPQWTVEFISFQMRKKFLLLVALWANGTREKVN